MLALGPGDGASLGVWEGSGVSFSMRFFLRVGAGVGAGVFSESTTPTRKKDASVAMIEFENFMVGWK